MDNVIGKEVYLPLATVKLSNQRRPRHPRAHQPPPTTNVGVTETDAAGLLLDLPCSSGAEEATRDGHAVGGAAVSGALNNVAKKEKYKHKHKRMGSGLKGIEDGTCARLSACISCCRNGRLRICNHDKRRTSVAL
jgi:hypothetical protein